MHWLRSSPLILQQNLFQSTESLTQCWDSMGRREVLQDCRIRSCLKIHIFQNQIYREMGKKMLLQVQYLGACRVPSGCFSAGPRKLVQWAGAASPREWWPHWDAGTIATDFQAYHAYPVHEANTVRAPRSCLCLGEHLLFQLWKLHSLLLLALFLQLTLQWKETDCK